MVSLGTKHYRACALHTTHNSIEEEPYSSYNNKRLWQRKSLAERPLNSRLSTKNSTYFWSYLPGKEWEEHAPLFLTQNKRQGCFLITLDKAYWTYAGFLP